MGEAQVIIVEAAVEIIIQAAAAAAVDIIQAAAAAAAVAPAVVVEAVRILNLLLRPKLLLVLEVGERNEQSTYNHINVLPLMIYAAFIFDARLQYIKFFKYLVSSKTNNTLKIFLT
jgi:hypothetical protein